MEVKEFITNKLLEIGADLEFTDDILKDLVAHAKSKAKNGCAMLSDEEVSNFVKNYDFKNKKPTVVKTKEPIVKKASEFEQIGLL